MITTKTSTATTTYVELRGLSTETKPTTWDGKDVANGSEFLEIDTGKTMYYDEENSSWEDPTAEDTTE